MRMMTDRQYAFIKRTYSKFPTPMKRLIPDALKQRAKAKSGRDLLTRDWSAEASKWHSVIHNATGAPPIEAYLELSKAYRLQGLLDDAENTLTRGLEHYPESKELLSAYASMASRQHKWHEAALRWQAVADAPDQSPISVSERLHEIKRAETAKLNFITYEEYMDNASINVKHLPNKQKSGHWKNANERWHYHTRAIDMIHSSTTNDPKHVLEMGTMGAQIVKGSHTIDYDEKWHFEGWNPTYVHDARSIPWPIDDGAYDWFVALRVFHHLWPAQRECFEEAKRVAKNVLIVAPPAVSETNLARSNRTDAGVTPADIRLWNEGKPARVIIPMPKYGYLYVI